MFQLIHPEIFVQLQQIKSLLVLREVSVIISDIEDYMLIVAPI